MVRKERLELSRREALEPKSSASTNSATFARQFRGRDYSTQKNSGVKSAANFNDCAPVCMGAQHFRECLRQLLESNRMGKLVQLLRAPLICQLMPDFLA